MKTSGILCASSSPSAPARTRHEPGMEDAFAEFCVLARPVEPELRDLFERAAAAETMDELRAAWAEIDSRRRSLRS